MSLTLDRFWKLLADSRLLDADEVGKLADASSKAQSNGGATPDKIAKWLVGKSRISAYQAKILLSGRTGPFFYGDYQIYDRIETGRLAGVFRAIHSPTKHPVCLYFLSGAQMQDQQIVAVLSQQAADTCRSTVGHPHLFRCYHLADLGSFKFIVIEDLKGKRVERLLATSGGPLNVDEACRITRQAAFGLARLHAMGQVHDELRPANIWLDANETAKLLLFPLYRDPLTQPRAWLAELQAGAPASKGKIPPEADYIAPELISGKRQPDERSDIYSLGCTLYHMLAGRPPFAMNSLTQKLKHHLKETPQPLGELNNAVPPGLAKLVNYMMAKDPDLRYQKAESVVEGLLPFLSPEAAKTEPVPPTRRSQAYEAWLAENSDQASIHGAATAMPAGPPSAVGANAGESAIGGGSFLGAGSYVGGAAAAVEIPHAVVATAAPVMAPPMAQPVMGAPMMATAVPVGQMGIPMAASVPMAAPAVGAMPGGVPMAMAVPVGGAMPGGAQQPAFAMGEAFGAPATSEATASGFSARSRAAKRRKKIMMFGLLGLLLVTAGTVAGLHFGGIVDFEALMASMSTPAPTATTPAKTTTPATTDVAVDGSQSDVMASRGKEIKTEPITGLDKDIWLSPTSGKPLDLKYLALGMQAVAALRPADILKHPQGKPLLAPDMSPAVEALAGQHPLGVIGHWAQHTLPTLAGVPLEQMEQVIVGWPESAGDTGTVAIVVRLTEPADEATLLAAWGNPSPTELEGKKYFTRESTGYYLPEEEQGRVIVIAPAEEIKEVVDGSQVLWATPEPEKLLQSSDADRHFTVVMPTRFLSAGGKAALEGRGSRLKGAVEWLLGMNSTEDGADPTKAVLLSAHLTDESFFAEARLHDLKADVQNVTAAQPIAERVRQIPRAEKLFKADLLMTPFSKPVLVELDDKVRAWEHETRVGTSDKQVVVRSYLPPTAGLHLALGTHLCLLENVMAGNVVAAPAGGGPANPAAPAGSGNTVADKLKKVTSLSFPRNTLEVSMQLLSEDLGCPVVILGTDLQLEGITKNQSFGLEERDKPAIEIFKTIFAKANPDGKLVYVIKPDESGTETIFVTTRAAAAKRGDKLPQEFATK